MANFVKEEGAPITGGRARIGQGEKEDRSSREQGGEKLAGGGYHQYPKNKRMKTGSDLV